MKRLLPIALLLVLALALAAWLLRPRPAPVNAGNTIIDSALAPASGGPLQARPDTPALPASHLPATEETPVATDQPPTPASRELLLHVPDYGELLWRGGARVAFELYDARGARIDVGEISAMRLHRRLGAFGTTEDVTRDDTENMLRAQGLGVAGGAYTGLEPGNYTLECESRRWGMLRHDFSVTRGEIRTERVTLPLYERVIAFRFTHPDGTPVAWLRGGPSVMYPEVSADDSRARPDSVLRSPPGQPVTGGGRFWSTSPSGRAVEGPLKAVQATDAGRWYARVVVGREGTVTFKLDQALWGQAEFSVTSTFEEGKWDDFTVELPTPPDFAALLEPMEKRGHENPGHRSLLAAEPLPRATDPLNDEISPGLARLLVALDCNVPAFLEAVPVGSSSTYRFTPHADGWFLDVSARSTLRCRATDGRWFSTPYWEVDPTAGGLVRDSRVVVAPVMRVSTEALGHTLRAFPVATTLTLDPLEEADGKAERGNQPTTVSGVFVPGRESFVDVPWGGGLFEKRDTWSQVQLRAELSGGSRLMKPRRGGSSVDEDGLTIYDAKVYRLEHDLDLAQGFDAVAAAGVPLQVRPMLALRAVGENGEGLPWVSGTLLEYEQDEFCQGIRDALGGTHPRIEADHLQHAEAMATEGEAREAAIENLIGEETARLLTQPQQREWFAKHGAWYDTNSRMRSHEHGYVLHERKLEPGKVYVLYLWSESRDDLKPDRRIVFKATEGVTDLGVITLPSYK